MTIERVMLLAVRWISVAIGTFLAKKAWDTVWPLATEASETEEE